MESTIPCLLSWRLWIGPAFAAAVLILSWRYLHEDPSNVTRRRARTAVYVLTLGILLWTVASALSNCGLREAVALLQQTVTGQQASIDNLKRQLGNANFELARQDAALRRQSTALRRQTAALAGADAAISAAERQAAVTRQEVASKAEVYHIPQSIARRMEAVLAETKHAYGVVACSPGLDVACVELGAVFSTAGWRCDLLRSAPFFPGPGPGVYIQYRVGHEQLARALAAILASGGLKADTRLGVSPERDIEINLIYIRSE